LLQQGRHRNERATSKARPADILIAGIRSQQARVGIVGLGYVGLPLAVEFAAVFPTLGFDLNRGVVASLSRGETHIGDVDAAILGRLVEEDRFAATCDFERLSECDCVVICVPTPLTADKQPDLSYILAAAQSIARFLRPGQLIVLESTTYPGTTDELLLPLMEEGGLKLDRDFFLAFSPERIDPANAQFELREIPKVVGGVSAASGDVATALYQQIFDCVHRVSTARAAETTKLLENTFRSVNIALVNEMALLFETLGIDTREVIEAASTKPFGFMAFSPGPGTGGHCVPIDPLYLSWKASRHGFESRFIPLADEINSAMPDHIARMAGDALKAAGKTLRGARVLVLGAAYKRNVPDLRCSPSVTVMERLRAGGAVVSYHDVFAPVVELSDGTLRSVELTDAALQDADCVVIATAHGTVDYRHVARLCDLVVDTRGVVPVDEHATVAAL
jgi:UDP-N-acetyl-D-glucosamine dehydrogenase